MNNKGFTLIELLAVLVLLAIIIGLTIGIFGFNFDETKRKAEEAFVATIKDSLEVYLTSKEAKNLNFQKLKDENNKECYLNKTHGLVKIYVATATFQAVIDSEYSPLSLEDLVNPAAKNESCDVPGSIGITIYRDDDYVYYYSVNRCSFGCLKNVKTKEEGGSVICDSDNSDNIITNLPEGIVCE